MDVGMKIKEYISGKGIAQAALGRQTGIDTVKLCLSLNGERKLTLEEYVLICNALGVKADYFLEKNVDGRFEEIGTILSEIKKELQDIRSILEPGTRLTITEDRITCQVR